MKRTETQNASLHKHFGQMAETLNDAGYSVMQVLRHDAEIPWTPELVKEHLWRPIQRAMTGNESTTECNTTDYNAINEVLCRHLGEKLGVTLPPWPSRFTMGGEDA